MLLDGGIQLESCVVARLSAKTVLSQNLSSHTAGALETLVPQLVMTSNCLGPRTEWWLSVGMKWALGPCQGLEKSFDSLKLSIASQGVARDQGCISRAPRLRKHLCLWTTQRKVWILTKDPPATPEGEEGVTLSLCNNRSPQTRLFVILSWRPLGNLGRHGVR